MSQRRSTPRATASMGSKARPRSSHATMAPAPWASAMQRSASVVLPLERSPRMAVLDSLGSPPEPITASRTGKPVETTSVGRGANGSALGAEAPRISSGSGASARAPRTWWSMAWSRRACVPPSAVLVGRSIELTGSPFPSRTAAFPQRLWSLARAVVRVPSGVCIARLMIEQMFYSSSPEQGRRRADPLPKARLPLARVRHCQRRAYLWRVYAIAKGALTSGACTPLPKARYLVAQRRATPYVRLARRYPTAPASKTPAAPPGAAPEPAARHIWYPTGGRTPTSSRARKKTPGPARQTLDNVRPARRMGETQATAWAGPETLLPPPTTTRTLLPPPPRDDSSPTTTDRDDSSPHHATETTPPPHATETTPPDDRSTPTLESPIAQGSEPSASAASAAWSVSTWKSVSPLTSR